MGDEIHAGLVTDQNMINPEFNFPTFLATDSFKNGTQTLAPPARAGVNAENADSNHFFLVFFQKTCVHLRLSASKNQSVGWLATF
jgi:hypothetical protein